MNKQACRETQWIPRAELRALTSVHTHSGSNVVMELVLLQPPPPLPPTSSDTGGWDSGANAGLRHFCYIMVPLSSRQSWMLFFTCSERKVRSPCSASCWIPQ